MNKMDKPVLKFYGMAPLLSLSSKFYDVVKILKECLLSKILFFAASMEAKCSKRPGKTKGGTFFLKSINILI